VELQVSYGQGPDSTMTIQDCATLDGIAFLDKEVSEIDHEVSRISYLKGTVML